MYGAKIYEVVRLQCSTSGNPSRLSVASVPQWKFFQCTVGKFANWNLMSRSDSEDKKLACDDITAVMPRLDLSPKAFLSDQGEY